MKTVALAIIAGLIATPALADSTPAPRQMDWVCGRVINTEITGGAAEVDFFTNTRSRYHFSLNAKTQPAMVMAAAEAVGSPDLIVIGYVPSLRPEMRYETAQVFHVGNVRLGCTELRIRAEEAYDRAYTQREIAAETSRPHPKIVRLKTMKHIR